MPVTVNINTAQIAMKIRAAAGKAVGTVAEIILDDCNEYCPKDQDGLIASSYTNSDILKGNLVWSTPYARYLYHGLLMIDPVTKSAYAREEQKKELASPEVDLDYDKTKNPNAGAHWCERAYADKHGEWQEIYEKTFREELNK